MTFFIHNCFILQYVYIDCQNVLTIICSSSGGSIVLMQLLVTSLSVSGRPVHMFRENCVLFQHMNRTATYWELRSQILHQYNSTSCWCP